MSYKSISLALSLTLLLLQGCSHAPLQQGFGKSTDNNERMQVVNSEAGKESVPTATLDGQKSERLLKSYRTDSGKASTSSIIDIK